MRRRSARTGSRANGGGGSGSGSPVRNKGEQQPRSKRARKAPVVESEEEADSDPESSDPSDAEFTEAEEGDEDIESEDTGTDTDTEEGEEEEEEADTPKSESSGEESSGEESSGEESSGEEGAAPPLSREVAVAAAKAWYEAKGPYAGVYRVATPVVGAYRNHARSWSLRYRTEPDEGEFFVRFDFTFKQGGSGGGGDDNGGKWEVVGMDVGGASEKELGPRKAAVAVAEGRRTAGAGAESKRSRERRLHQQALRAARKERQRGAKVAAAANKKKHEDVERDKEAMAKRRMAFLMEHADVFRQFLGSDHELAHVADKQKSRRGRKAGAGVTRRRHRLTEKQEDGRYMKEQQMSDREEVIPRLTVQDTQGFIQFGQMRDYQVEGLNWIIRLYHRGLNGILADEMGLGKTLQTISMLGYLHTFKNISGPHLVVVPKSTLGHWSNEFGRWFPALRVLKFHGSKDHRELLRVRELQYGKFDVVLTTYETVITEKGALRTFAWEYLVIDEAHRIKNENSALSQIVRIYNTKCRLLITGTPLQNNLHELWALLNFLLPDVFSDAEMFETYASAVGDEKQELISQLHRVLKPFILRRLKAEVEKGLPSKKELSVYCNMTRSQRQTYCAVLKNNVDVLNGMTNERVKLQNVVMQLRKACNHPYLFDGVEDKSLDPFGEHLVEQSGKLMLLDKLLPRLKDQGSRVLIFSQMTRLLDILEDYCGMREHLYCRIDGSTSSDVRDQMIEDYNRPQSKYFIFLLSTRAGGLGINLTSADVVVLYDSDWNPQMDLQAQDRAHRIGQTKPVKVFRLVTEHTIEEKVLDRAMKKLHLDALVIQQGRLADKDKKTSKGEMSAAIRYGADDIFKQTANNDEGELIIDIDAILEKAEQKTSEMNKKYENAIKQGTSSKVWTFDGEDVEKSTLPKALGEASRDFIDIGKRVRKQTKTYGATMEEDDDWSDGEGAEGREKGRRGKKRSKGDDGTLGGVAALSLQPGSAARSAQAIPDTFAGRWHHILMGAGAGNFGDRRRLSRTEPSELRRRVWDSRELMVPGLQEPEKAMQSIAQNTASTVGGNTRPSDPELLRLLLCAWRSLSDATIYAALLTAIYRCRLRLSFKIFRGDTPRQV
jgi:ERCC4-related helicase